MLPRLRQARRAAGPAGAAATRCPAQARPEWPRRALCTLTHPHLQTLAPPRPDDPTKTATATKAFSTSATPRSPPSTLQHTTTRHRDLLNWRTRPPSLCRYPSPVLCSPRRFATSPTMAHEWSGIKVRKTFFDFFAERGHSIGMLTIARGFALLRVLDAARASCRLLNISSCYRVLS